MWLADRFLNGSQYWMSLAALAVMAGHAFPVFLKFHGGKAVASFVGAFLYLTPLPLCGYAGRFRDYGCGDAIHLAGFGARGRILPG